VTDEPVVLAIGGLDPSGGAGLLADAAAIRASGGRPLAVATALTFQSTRRARGFRVVSWEELQAQLAPLVEDEPIAAVKVGMIGAALHARQLAALRDGALGRVPWVLDPVLAASSGGPLVELFDAYDALLPKVELVTPNAPELGRLADVPPPTSPSEAERAARALLARGARAVLCKGGHVEGEPVDRLVTAETTQDFTDTRLPVERRGTGCRLASAIATGLARGLPLALAIDDARALVRRYLVTGQCR